MAVSEEISSLLTRKNKFFLPQIQDLYLFTINHKTAPIPIREKFAIPEYNLTEACQRLKSYKSLKSFLTLSTCNRTEIYFTNDNLEASLSDIYNFFAKYLDLEQKITKEYNSLIKENDVVDHAFKLACGLDSLVVGERQILSQVKSAYSIAQKEKTLDKTLELLFQSVIKTAKEVHKKTNLSKNSQSISSAAIDLANKICGPLKTKSIMVLGAGTMAKLTLDHIQKIGGSKETVVLNRSPHRVIEFSEKYKIDKSIPFEDVYHAMNAVDIVITATGAPHFIIFAEQFNQVRKDPLKPLYIFDISMPRNVDSEFGKMLNVQLIDIDSLQTIYNQSIQANKKDLAEAENIIFKNTDLFYLQVEEKKVDELVKNLKEKVEKIRSEKLSQFTSTKDSLTKEEVDYITKNIMNTMFHVPLKNLKNGSIYSSRNEKLKVLRDLFEI